MSQKPQNSQDEKSEKKVTTGSFAVSLFLHALVLVLIGSIIIVPGAIKKMMPVTSVAPPPVTIPEPPKIDQNQDMVNEDAGGNPPGPADLAPETSTETGATDALVLDTPSPSGPTMNAANGAAANLGETFNRGGGGQGGSGGGTGNGIGRGSGSGIQGRKTFFGSTEKLDSALIGKFYVTSLGVDRKPIAQAKVVTFKDIIKSGFAPASFANFYKAHNLLYAEHLVIPEIDSSEASKAFGVDKEVQSGTFIIHYSGMVAPTKDVTIRLDGYGDDWFLIAIDKKIVLDGSYVSYAYPAQKPDDFKETDPNVPIFSGNHFTYGTWIEWKKDDFKRIDIIVGDILQTAGVFDKTCSGLYVEEKGKTYDKGAFGVPILPLFRVSSATPKVMETSPFIQFQENGPVFQSRGGK